MGADEAAIVATSISRSWTITRTDWSVPVGACIQLQESTNLITQAWNDQGSSLTATQMSVVILDTNTTADLKYYRLKWLYP